MDIYNIKIKEGNDSISSMDNYRGKTLLIVNTATGCGFTPQYEGIQVLYKKYKSKGLEILDFPCNQFGNQAPGSNKEIASFCQLKYDTTFKTFAKIDVNGENEEDLYKFLKSEKGGLFSSKIKWNFTKFLVDNNGNVLKRYSPTVSLDKIEKDLLKIIA